MSVLTKVRNGIIKTAEKGADAVTTLSQLSPSQVRTIDDKREKYLSEMPSLDDAAAEEITKRNIGAISVEVCNSYLPQISKLYLPIQESNNFEGNNRIAYFEITKWVKDPDEDNIEKLMSVYQVLSQEECNIALIYNRTKSRSRIFLAIVNNSSQSDPNEVETYKKRILGALKGSFPGADCVEENKNEIGFGVNVPSCLRINNEDKISKSVAIVSNLATEKSEKFVSQTIEKVLDGIVPSNEKEEYSIVLLATPVIEQYEKINRLYELYSALAPYASWQTNFTFTEMQGVSSSATFGLNIGASAGTQNGVSRSDGTTNSTTNSSQRSNTVGASVSASKTAQAGVNLGAVRTGASTTLTGTASTSTTKTTGIAKTVAKVVTNTVNNASNFGINAGANFSRSSSVTATLGKNEGIIQNFLNYGVKHVLDNLEKQVKRLEESAALGLWDFAAYVISGDSIVANNVAHTYFALTQGEESFLAESAVNLWRADLPEAIDEKFEKKKAESIMKSLSRLQHPEFCLAFEGNNRISEDFLMYPSCINATISLSGKELARALNFPSKSICGVPVIETASFGRNVASYNNIDQDLKLGASYHMHMADKNADISLSKKSMTSHVFVTGSTGSGKTNTVAELLKKTVLDSNDDKTTFLVIEPAKGEYKDLLGGYSSVKVYGTNPNKTELLRINPFSFPDDITVSEHIDRLVEIFNVCWPMYAAMPAILKDAIIRAYEVAGWDIESSYNTINSNLYPGFVDVMEQVKVIVNSSEYSADTKGDYSGALLSRINSLTNGINGQIFSVNAISDNELFNNNVIIDMSRVGSVETKSLIMGILLLKLQEFRLAEKAPNRKELEHITVLEEAHNLLRRTSVEQSSESSNLLGKSVEMLTNSIAELRAFGEGFIIADQAPGLLDMAVIRNTNTKIVHRLPEQSDRELVGKAMGMSDSQISELAKLELGVAAIYQNDWIEPVLCKVDEFKLEDKKPLEIRKYNIDSEKQVKKQLADYLIKREICNKGNRVDLQRISELVLKSQMSVLIKRYLIEYLSSQGDEAFEYLRKLIYEVLDAKDAIIEANKEDKLENWVEKLKENVTPSLKNYSKEQIDLAIGLIIYEQYEREGSAYRKIFEGYSKLIEEGIK